MTADDLDLDALAALEAECKAADADMRKWVRVPVKHVRALIAAARENDDLRASLGDAQRLTSDAYERASTSLMRRVDLAMEAARIRAERDAAQAALARVEALHVPQAVEQIGGGCAEFCSACPRLTAWPCATTRAVVGEGRGS